MDTVIANNDKIVNSILKREAERQLDLQKKRNEKKLSNAENEQRTYFSEIFQDKLTEILNLLDLIPNSSEKEMAHQFDKIFRDVHTLQKFVADSVIFLRGYDIRKSQQSLQEIEIKARKLEEKFLPKKKFGFKHKSAKRIQDTVDIKQNGRDDVDNARKTFRFDEQFFGFRNQNNSLLTFPRDSLNKKDVALQNLEHCVVKLEGSPSTLHMNSLNNCIVLCGPVSTSIFAENCKNCKFVVACQQLRLHSSTKCDIYLHVTSKAIIEDCNAIYVAPYNYVYISIFDDFKDACLDLNCNHWNQLDDFNWLVLDKQSPNWSILEDSCRIVNWEEYSSTFLKLITSL